MIIRITAKSALNKLDSKYLPYQWDLNIYRGCSHHCQYCYAQYSHQYLSDDNFFGDIYVKKNIVELLEKKLASKRWKRQAINLGGVTDSYQVIEAEEKLMPEILKILIKYRNPVVISTKSKLILRDFELWDILSRVANVNLAVSLTTFNKKIYRKTEPHSSTPWERLEILKTFRKTKVNLGVLCMPFLPYLTDRRENIEDLFGKISNVPADFALCGLLNLKGQTRKHFLSFIEKEFGQIYPKYLKLYKGAFVDKEYRNNFYQMVNELKRKYGIRNNYQVTRESEQLGLW